MKLFNILICQKWIENLKQVAREESVKQKRNISVSQIIRNAIKEKYKQIDK